MSHLDIPEDRLTGTDSEFYITQACKELGQMNKTKVVKGKLNSLNNFCKLVSSLLSSTAKDGQADGADMFMPATIPGSFLTGTAPSRSEYSVWTRR